MTLADLIPEVNSEDHQELVRYVAEERGMSHLDAWHQVEGWRTTAEGVDRLIDVLREFIGKMKEWAAGMAETIRECIASVSDIIERREERERREAYGSDPDPSTVSGDLLGPEVYPEDPDSLGGGPGG